MLKNILLLIVFVLILGAQDASAQRFSMYDFANSRNMGIGSFGQDVYVLQDILNNDVDTRISDSGPGSPGMETQYFGLMTENAVKRFQIKYRDEILTPNGLVNATGFVGPATIKTIQRILGKTTGATVSPTKNTTITPERDPNLVIFSFVPYELSPESPIVIVLGASSTDFEVYVNDKLLNKKDYETKDKQYIYIEKKTIKDKEFFVHIERNGKISNKLEYVVNSETGINIFEKNYYKNK